MAQMWMALLMDEPDRIDDVIRDSFDIPENCQWATFLRNHDEIELNTLSPGERHALVDALDPKHHYTFRKGEATSMRIAEIFDGNRDKILEALLALYSAPGATIMYYGDEIGMRNLPLEQGVVDTRRYVRGAFDWDDAHHQAADPESLFSQCKKIIAQGPRHTVQKKKE
jgi:maltose alpha-D-glucosyltransferase/alpha-amylase